MTSPTNSAYCSEVLIQEGRKPLRWQDFKDVWDYRELIYFLSLRDIKVKYKQAALGIIWVVAQPLFWMISYTFLFGKIAKIESQGLPYPVFSFAALVPWMFFTGACNKGSLSLVGSGTLFSKVYFPRLVIPIAAVLAGLLDYSISVLSLVAVLAYYGIFPQWSWIWGVGLSTLWIYVFSLGVSFWLGALNVKYRDVGHMLPFLMQAWMFLTPVVYPLSVIPARYQGFIQMNPMVGIIEFYRHSLFNTPLNSWAVSLSLVATALVFFTGLVYFKSTERTFADIV